MHILTDTVLRGEIMGHDRIFPATLRPATFSETFQRNPVLKAFQSSVPENVRFLLFDTNNFPGAP